MTLARAMGDTVKRIDGTEPSASDILLGRAPAPGRAPEGPAPRQEPREPPADAARAETERRAPEAAARPPVAEVAPEPASEGAPSEEDRPELLSAPRAGGPDDLKRIKGIGPKLEGVLNTLGVYHLDQIASWGDREVAWVDYHLEGFKGRIRRDDWVAQAEALVAEDRS